MCPNPLRPALQPAQNASLQRADPARNVPAQSAPSPLAIPAPGVPAQYASKLLSDFHALLDKYDFDQAEAQIDFIQRLLEHGLHMTEEEMRELGACGRAVFLGRKTHAKFGPPKAPEMTVLAADCQEPPSEYAPYEVEPCAPAYVEQVQGCDPSAPESAQDFREGV
jgi:hypothetical protein